MIFHPSVDEDGNPLDEAAYRSGGAKNRLSFCGQQDKNTVGYSFGRALPQIWVDESTNIRKRVRQSQPDLAAGKRDPETPNMLVFRTYSNRRKPASFSPTRLSSRSALLEVGREESSSTPRCGCQCGETGKAEKFGLRCFVSPGTNRDYKFWETPNLIGALVAIFSPIVF